MLQFSKNFLLSLIIFSMLDIFWVGVIANNFYRHYMGDFVRQTPVLWASSLVYLLMALGFSIFVLPHSNTIVKANLRGAFLGLVVYGVYQATNLTSLAPWNYKLLVINILWGVFICGITAMIVYALNKILKQ